MLALPASISSAGVYAACTIVPIVATLLVALRFWTRRIKRINLGADDWFILVATVLMWGANGLILAGTSEKIFGYHTKQDPDTGVGVITWREFRQVEFTTIIFLLHVATLGAVKLSVVLLYRRLFAVNRAFNIWSLILSTLVVLWCISFLFAFLFECGIHYAAPWSLGDDSEKYCDKEPIASTTFCVTDVLGDFVILATPLPAIWKLKMSLSQKLALCAVFALGLFSTAAGLIRAVLTGIFELGTEEGFRDLLAANTIIVVWCVVEAGSAIIGACLPTVRPLFHKAFLDNLFGSLQSIFSSKLAKGSKGSRGRSEPHDYDMEDEIGLRTTGEAQSTRNNSFTRPASR